MSERWVAFTGTFVREVIRSGRTLQRVRKTSVLRGPRLIIRERALLYRGYCYKRSLGSFGKGKPTGNRPCPGKPPTVTAVDRTSQGRGARHRRRRKRLGGRASRGADEQWTGRACAAHISRTNAVGCSKITITTTIAAQQQEHVLSENVADEGETKNRVGVREVGVPYVSLPTRGGTPVVHPQTRTAPSGFRCDPRTPRRIKARRRPGTCFSSTPRTGPGCRFRTGMCVCVCMSQQVSAAATATAVLQM